MAGWLDAKTNSEGKMLRISCPAMIKNGGNDV